MVIFQRFRHLFKEGLWIVLGQVMLVVGSLLGVRLLTGLLDPTAYGELALAMTLATLVNQTVLGPLSQGVMRFYAPAVEQGNLGGYLNAVRRMTILATGVIVLLTIVGLCGLTIAGKYDWIGITVASLMFAIVNSYSSIVSGIQMAARQRSIVALHQGMEPLARFLFAALFIVSFGATSTVTAIGYTVGIILLLVSQFIFFRKIIPQDTKWKSSGKTLQQQIWDYSWPFSIWGSFYWLQSSADRWALGLFATTQEIGLYAVLFQLGYYPMSMATGMAVQLITPIFYQRAGDGSDVKRNAEVHKLSWLLTKLSLGVTAASVAIAALVHTQVFEIFVTKEYRSVSPLLPWIVLSGGLFAAGQTISLNLMSQMKTQKIMKAKITTSVLSVIFTFAGAYFYSTTGIVIASILASLVYLILMILLQQNELRLTKYTEDGS
jgi:O-antigen/teichoic acid export membrane protein